jgi:hypothetical protein
MTMIGPGKDNKIGAPQLFDSQLGFPLTKLVPLRENRG